MRPALCPRLAGVVVVVVLMAEKERERRQLAALLTCHTHPHTPPHSPPPPPLQGNVKDITLPVGATLIAAGVALLAVLLLVLRRGARVLSPRLPN